MSELRVKIEIDQHDDDGDQINSISVDLVPPDQDFAMYVMRVLHAAACPPPPEPSSFIIQPYTMEGGLR